MKGKIVQLGVLIVLLLFSIPSFHIAKADHHHYKHEKYKKYSDWDDDEDEWKSKYKSHEKSNITGTEHQLQPSYWNIWTRDTSTFQSSDLPIQESKEVSFDLNGKSEKLFVLPSNGQLLVSGEKIANFLGIKSKFYSQSRILELSNNNEELIVRAGTNAAYENMVKTPMPTKAIYYEKTVYLPISVVCNAFGYSVNWNIEKSTFTLQKFN